MDNDEHGGGPLHPPDMSAASPSRPSDPPSTNQPLSTGAGADWAKAGTAAVRAIAATDQFEILGGKGIVADDRGFVMGDIEQATPFFSGQ